MMFKYAPRRFLAVLSCLYLPWTTVAWMINLLRAQPWNASLAALYIAFLCTPSSSRNSRRNCRATSKAYIQKSMNQIALQICRIPWFLEISMWNLQCPQPCLIVDPNHSQPQQLHANVADLDALRPSSANPQTSLHRGPPKLSLSESPWESSPN